MLNGNRCVIGRLNKLKRQDFYNGHPSRESLISSFAVKVNIKIMLQISSPYSEALSYKHLDCALCTAILLL